MRKRDGFFFVLLVTGLFFADTAAFAEEVEFLGYRLESPPEIGSAESDDDFLRLHDIQDQRTAEDCARASTQSRLTLESGFGPGSGILSSEEIKESRLLAAAVIAKAMIPVIYFKKVFQRTRPWVADPALVPCIPKPRSDHQAYPSGHSTIGYALALALARKFPEKRDLILNQGIQIGENRVIGGVHHPSDVIAGRKLAEQVVSGMIRQTPASFRWSPFRMVWPPFRGQAITAGMVNPRFSFAHSH
jgi:acid phosphatase (class A)